MRILIAPDKFKGSLTAAEAADALRDGFLQVWPGARIESMPIADGGEGTAEALQKALHGAWVDVAAHDPLGRSVPAKFCWIKDDPKGPLAIVEMSEASGLRRLRENEKNPRHASTRGTGELIREAAQRGAAKIIVGIGGSATNDGGIGMAAALGYRFLDSSGTELDPIPENLPLLHAIVEPPHLNLPPLLAAVDVANPLLGARGATRAFGPQKGASPADLEFLELGLARLAEIVRRDLGRHFAETPGAGAAGGLGFGLLTFCHAEMRSGFELVSDVLNLEQAVTRCHLVITAEGCMDAQTLEGKGPAGVARLARKHGKPVIAFAGRVSDEEKLLTLFQAISPIPDGPMALEESLLNAKTLLRRAAARAAKLMEVQIMSL